MKFVALHMNEYMLHAFCGARGPNESPLKKSNFLDHLRQKRNNAVDQQILAKMYESEPHLKPDHLPKGAKKLVDPSTLPPIVSVRFPAVTYRGESSPEIDVLMPLEVNPLKCVSIACDVGTLNWLRLSVMTWEGERKKRKAPSERMETGYTFIVPDYRRASLKVNYRNADGAQKVKFCKPAAWEPDCVSHTCDTLIEWLRENHYALSDDGVWALASDLKADMFSADPPLGGADMLSAEGHDVRDVD